MITRMRDGTGRRHYRYLTEDTDRHGNVRIYFRRGGRKTRLTATPGTPEFDAQYQRAFKNYGCPVCGKLFGCDCSGRRRAANGTLRWLVEQYYGSAVYQALNPTTKVGRRRALDAICERAGANPFALMEPRHVAKLRDEKAALPGSANERVKALRSLFKWAESPEYGLARSNPAEKVAYLPAKNPDGFKAWTEEDLAAFEAFHPIGTKPRLALDLLLYTGVRRSDVVRLGPQMERGGHLVFSETKGKARITKEHRLPILPELRVSIDAAPTGHLVYLISRWGKPYSIKGFSDWFKVQCRRAAVDDALSAHGLRKLGAQRCVERGATQDEVMALYGWTNPKQAALYTRKARRQGMEAKAVVLLRPTKVVPIGKREER